MPTDGLIGEVKMNSAGSADNSESTKDLFYHDIEERRLKEWANYQRSHRTEEDQDANRAFLDFSIDDVLVGRIVVELFSTEAPHAVSQFRRLVTGSLGVDSSTGTKLDYLHTNVNCIDKEKGFITMGDLDTQGVSLHPQLDTEFVRRHSERGLLTTVSPCAKVTSTSIGITLGPAPALDFHQVVFGRVIDGMTSLDKIEALPLNAAGRPLSKVRVAFCGVLTGEQPPGVWSAEQTV